MNTKIAKQIQIQQDHGRQKYGRGPKDYRHDDEHTGDEWQDMIEGHSELLFHATPQEYREELVKIAGLAVSAIESFDRDRKRGGRGK
jgi:hypothetical protein